MSAREAAKKWNISQRRVSILCSERRIPDVAMLGNMWIIPRNAEKPVDARMKRNAVTEKGNTHPFVKWAGGKGQLLDVLKANLPNGMGTAITKYAEPFVVICTPKVRQTFGGAYFYEKKEGMEHKILARIKNICYTRYAK